MRLGKNMKRKMTNTNDKILLSLTLFLQQVQIAERNDKNIYYFK